MQSRCIREASQACLHGCFPTPFPTLAEPSNPNPNPNPLPTTTTTATSRFHFASATMSSLLPNTQFTNHESLPPLPECFSNFTKVYPQYTETEQADDIRANDYFHLSLSNRVCLDYNGFGLFSHLQLQSSMAASSSSPNSGTQFSFFDLSYKSTSLKSQILYGGQEPGLESGISKRIMGFLNISENDYSMVCTANRASAFKLLAESYPFESNGRLLTVYDYESEAVRGMVESSQKRGAKVMSANFSWQSLRIQSTKLKKMLVSRRKKKKKGLFVFPLQSRMSGARYSYLWMSMAQENGWHVLLDACALGPKDMDTLGLSLFQPDFLICSFFQVFGENPSGFGCLFVKRSSASVLEASTMARSIGIVSIVPPRKPSNQLDYSSATDSDAQSSKIQLQDDDLAITISFSGPMSVRMSDGEGKRNQKKFEPGETSELRKTDVSIKQADSLSSEIVELEKSGSIQSESNEGSVRKMDPNPAIECRCLDHADSLGLPVISSRARILVNWLVNALMKLQHPNSEKGIPLVKIYGPRVKFNRGPAVAFNVFDWKGEKVEPILVQKLADRSNISLSYGFLHNIWFPDKYEEDKEKVLETRSNGVTLVGKRKEKVATGVTVVTAAIGFLANFEDIYRLWAFVAKFLDADFVEKERWRYMALNQKTVEI
ncbi:pyridoxal phosphate (PLP)-dependent transferases superfamily protein [Tasmannia lanceolata]|uniref:pyridoxal phosphate (PLP)-dependent transferases superfamily protein n=1 Tax=Tasmannia lanceolata TaxID=3420 RepID=UPI0040646C34